MVLPPSRSLAHALARRARLPPFAAVAPQPYFIRATLLQFNHRWNQEKLRQSKDGKTSQRLDWLQKNRWRISHTSNWSWVWGNAAVYLLVAVAYEYINTPNPLPGQWLPYEQCLDRTRYMVVVLAAMGTLLLAGSYATFYDVADAFFFKKELAVMMVVLPSCYLLWALLIFGVSPSVTEVESAYFIYAAIYAALMISIYLPLGLSIRQAYMIRHFKDIGIDTATSEEAGSSDDAPAPLNILEDKPDEWVKNTIRISELTRPANRNISAVARALAASSTTATLPSTVAADGTGSSGGGSSGHRSKPSEQVPSDVDQPSTKGSNGSGSKKRSSRSGGTIHNVIPPRTPTSRLFSITLVNDTLRMAFQRYCMQSWCIENYLFYRDGMRRPAASRNARAHARAPPPPFKTRVRPLT